MDWWRGRVDLALVACMASDLRRMAEADDEMHDREVALVQVFERAGGDAQQAETMQVRGDALQRSYLRALIMLALVDGELAEEELVVLRDISAVRGIPDAVVEDVLRRAQRDFFGRVPTPIVAPEHTDEVEPMLSSLMGEEGEWN